MLTWANDPLIGFVTKHDIMRLQIMSVRPLVQWIVISFTYYASSLQEPLSFHEVFLTGFPDFLFPVFCHQTTVNIENT